MGKWRLAGKGRCLLFPVPRQLAPRAGDFNARTTYPLVPFSLLPTAGPSVWWWAFRGHAARTFQRMEGPYLGGQSRPAGERRHGQLAQLTVIRFGPSVAWRRRKKLEYGCTSVWTYVEAIDESDITTQRCGRPFFGRADRLFRHRRLTLKVRDSPTPRPTNTFKINGPSKTTFTRRRPALVPGVINARIPLH